MADGTNNSARLVPCSFCDDKFSSSAIGEHLMTCGNKTDQCPNCRKYIRRAIFAYHYENGCANLEEIDTDDKTAVNQRNTPSTFQPNNPPPSLSQSTAKTNKQITIIRVELPEYSRPQTTISQRSDSDFCESNQITIICPYCYQECEIGERDKHNENCLQNPVNTNKRQLLQTNGTSTQDRLHYDDQSDNTSTVPCEICKEPVEWRYFEAHLAACVEREQKRRQQQSRPTNEEDNSRMTRCRYCNEKRHISALDLHERLCQSGKIIPDDESYRQIFRPLPLQTRHTRPN